MGDIMGSFGVILATRDDLLLDLRMESDSDEFA